MHGSVDFSLIMLVVSLAPSLQILYPFPTSLALILSLGELLHVTLIRLTGPFESVTTAGMAVYLSPAEVNSGQRQVVFQAEASFNRHALIVLSVAGLDPHAN